MNEECKRNACLDCQGESPDEGTYCKVYEDLDPEKQDDVFSCFEDLLADAVKDNINIELSTDTDTISKLKQERDYYQNLAAQFAKIYADYKGDIETQYQNIADKIKTNADLSVTPIFSVFPLKGKCKYTTYYAYKQGWCFEPHGACNACWYRELFKLLSLIFESIDTSETRSQEEKP